MVPATVINKFKKGFCSANFADFRLENGATILQKLTTQLIRPEIDLTCFKLWAAAAQYKRF